NPVCTSATKKVNQSSPRWLRRDAAIGGSGGGVCLVSFGRVLDSRLSPSTLRRSDVPASRGGGAIGRAIAPVLRPHSTAWLCRRLLHRPPPPARRACIPAPA